ncbi:MAG TPA: ATP-binding cassette domain-containing protein [bacterium]|nr:ATP-binding cassette domain-containing protein [bacterium]
MLSTRGLRLRSPHGSLALDDVTVVAHPGEVVVLVGPNGSGKSTLLRTLAGLVRPDAGTIHLNGEPLLPHPAHRRAGRGLAYAPAPPGILAGLSVRDNLEVGAWHRRDRRAVARDLHRILEEFPPLREHLHHRAESLPAAPRRMLALGRAVMSAPQALLLDEPLGGLDAQAAECLRRAIRRIRDEGVALLAAEHDLSGALAIADRAYGFRGGRVVFSGSPSALAYAAASGEIYG